MADGQSSTENGQAPAAPKKISTRNGGAAIIGRMPCAPGKKRGRPVGSFKKKVKAPLTDAETPASFKALTAKQKTYVLEHAINGKKKGEAILAAGGKQWEAIHPGKAIEIPAVKLAMNDYREAFAEKGRTIIPDERLWDKLDKNLESTKKSYFSQNGLVVDSREDPDHPEIRKTVVTIAKLSGRFHETQDVNVVQSVDEATARRLADIADKLGITQMSREERKELGRSYVVVDEAGNETYPLLEAAEDVVIDAEIAQDVPPESNQR